MMNSFLKNDGRKLIITDNVSGMNKIIRRASSEGIIYGVDIVTINQLAAELFLSYIAIYEGDKTYKIIDENMQAMRMLAVLKDMDVTFLTPETKTISSSNEILSVLNKIRTNLPSDKFTQSDKTGTRIYELKCILDEYEKLLKNNFELDGAMVLDKAIALLNLAQKKPDALNYLSIFSPLLYANLVGGFFTQKLSGMQNQFLNILIDILGDKYSSLEFKSQNNTGYDFFKAYGIANEVKHIKDTILSEGLHLGEVAIIYPNNSYEHFFMSQFDEAQLKYCFPRGFCALASDYVSFLADLLDFAASDFEYKRLYRVLQNPVIQIKKVRTAYRAFLSEGIGYGRERYLSFFSYYDSLSLNEKIKNEEYVPFYNFLVDLIKCFAPENSCEKMFRSLLKIAGTYTDNKDLYRACVRDDLYSYVNALSIFEGSDFKDKLFQIETFLKKLKCRTSESTDAISILPYGKTDIIDRQFIFAVGLSNENVTTPNAESPVLCDNDLKSCVEGNVPLAMERNKRMKDAFIDTLRLSMQKKVYCSYSYYDTVSIINNSPSLLFQELLEENGIEDKSIHSFGYDVYKESLTLKCHTINKDSKCNGEVDENVQIQKLNDEEDDVERFKHFSASSMQNLIHCPLSYYYEKVRRIPQLTFQERTPDTWLPANVKGNVFHHVMEKYVNEVIIRQGQTAINEGVLLGFFEEEIAECIKTNPISSQVTFETEKEDYKEVLRKYITELHAELACTNKKVIGCEVDFSDISYIGKIDIDGKSQDAYELLLRGSVDRLDGVLEENGTLKLQIYDYKTGSYSKKEEDIASGNQIQHHIYAIAMEQWAADHKQELEQLFGQTIEKIVFDDVRYIFPYEEEKRELKAVCIFDENSGKPVLPNGTHNILLCIVANYQKGNLELAVKLSADIAHNMAVQDKKLCRYCNYTEVCRACILINPKKKKEI